MFFCSECGKIYEISKGSLNAIKPETQLKSESSTEGIESLTLSSLTNDTPKDESSENLKNSKKEPKKVKKNQDTEEVVNQMYFACKLCGNSEPIKPGTLIMSKTSGDILHEYQSTKIKPDNLIKIDTYMRTRNYLCPNKECLSYTDLSKREAIILRLGDTFKVTYICTACKTIWNP